jgi:ribosomal protein S11
MEQEKKKNEVLNKKLNEPLIHIPITSSKVGQNTNINKNTGPITQTKNEQIKKNIKQEREPKINYTTSTIGINRAETGAKMGLSPNANRDLIVAPFGSKIDQYCCIIHITWKKNNVFVNLTKINGETIIKFSAGLIQKKKNKKLLNSLIKWIFEKVTFFAKVNFTCVKIIIKGNNNINFAYLKDVKRKQLKVISYQYHIPILHNGCRPPKKRRI